jgi:formylglycine-generating enzyme
MIDILEVRRSVASAFGSQFVPVESDEGGAKLPRFECQLTGHKFRYLAGGEFEMGLSSSQELAARAIFDPFPANVGEMRPVHRVHVDPFLIAERPVLTKETVAGAVSKYPESAAYLSHEQALAFCAERGMSLPNEAQWEYACRAGTATLFTWGDQLPSEQELKDWLVFDFSRSPGKPNAFGLSGLFVGEWCTDGFTESYEQAHPPRIDGPRVIRGGGAYFWPWQDQEWVWCMSAMRAPSSDLPENICGLRFVKPMPQQSAE